MLSLLDIEARAGVKMVLLNCSAVTDAVAGGEGWIDVAVVRLSVPLFCRLNGVNELVLESIEEARGGFRKKSPGRFGGSGGVEIRLDVRGITDADWKGGDD
jgi:hypothetical protein